MKRGGVEPNMDLLHAISIPINLELFYSNCRLLEKNTSNDDDDTDDDKEKQEVHYTNGPFLITDLTDFMQQTWEITYD